MRTQEGTGLLRLTLTLVLVLVAGWALSELPGALASLAIFMVTVYAASHFIYVVHDLPSRQDAFQFMLTYLFGLNYPVILISEGMIAEKSRGMPAAKLGGPGIVLVTKDSAAVLERGKEIKVIGPGGHKLKRGERVKEAVDLRPQVRSNTVTAMTKDGFEVEIMYLVGFQIDQGGRRPTQEEPYPFSRRAVLQAVYQSKLVGAQGAQMWHERVPGAVFGNVREMIATHYLEQLFEPDKPGEDPRSELKQGLVEQSRGAAANVGARLNWVSFGTPKIPDETARKYVDYYGAKLQSKIKGVEAEAQDKAFRVLANVFDRLSSDNKIDRLVRIRFIEALEAISKEKSSKLVLPYEVIDRLRPSLPGETED